MYFEALLSLSKKNRDRIDIESFFDSIEINLYISLNKNKLSTKFNYIICYVILKKMSTLYIFFEEHILKMIKYSTIRK